MSGKKVKIDNYITGTKLKGFRQQKGLSLAKAAHEIGVQRLSAWLKTGNVGSASKKSIRWSSYMERHWKTLPLPAALGRKK